MNAPTVASGEPVAWLCRLKSKDAGWTLFFTAPSDPRGFPVYLTANQAAEAPAVEGGEAQKAVAVEHRKALADHAIHLALNVMDPFFDGTDRWFEVCAAINALRDAAPPSPAAAQGLSEGQA